MIGRQVRNVTSAEEREGRRSIGCRPPDLPSDEARPLEAAHVEPAAVTSSSSARLTRAVAIGTGANLVLALALVPVLGIEGAAIAAAVGTVSTQVLLEIDVRRRAGLSAAAFLARAR